MAAAPAPNPRASLLAGLRTGGVRSTSGPMGNVPHTAAVGSSFSVPRYASSTFHSSHFPPEEEDDELADMVSQNMYINSASHMQHIPMTAAVDGSNDRFAHQQSARHRGMASGGVSNNPNNDVQRQAQAQALQMQMLQVEMLRLHAIQAQKLQSEYVAQAQQYHLQLERQRQQLGLPYPNGPSPSYNPPATAGAYTTSFDLRSMGMNAPMRRPSQAEQLRAQLGVHGEDQVPMTAALGGKFGSRALYPGMPEDDSSAPESKASFQNPPATPNHTTVISGGTSLGTAANSNTNSNTNVNANVVPSKSDTAVSWRRGGHNNSVLSGNRSISLAAPNVKITPPPTERTSSPPGLGASTSPVRSRPQPLRFSAAVSRPLPAVAVDDGTDGEDNSSVTSSKSGSSPTTPHSSSSGDVPLSPREEAAKKLYEGLGLGRAPPATAALPQRVLSLAVRQPRGPPSGADELGPRNFASRIRRKAIGGLGALMGARERRDVVEAY